MSQFWHLSQRPTHISTYTNGMITVTAKPKTRTQFQKLCVIGFENEKPFRVRMMTFTHIGIYRDGSTNSVIRTDPNQFNFLMNI